MKIAGSLLPGFLVHFMYEGSKVQARNPCCTL